MPLLVHTRKAEAETINLLQKKQAKKIVLHCFSGNLKLVKQAADLGYSFSIPPNILFSTHFQRVVEEVDINHLLTETDSPYLGPFKGKRNEPAYVRYTIKKIAEIKGFEEKEVEDAIFLNYQRMF